MINKNHGFYISSTDNEINKNDEIWNKLLPVNRYYENSNSSNITFGEYFEATFEFIFSEDNKLYNYIKCNYLNNSDTKNIKIIIKKHGEFYHPAKVIFETCDKIFSIVLNVAFSEAGKYCINSEITALAGLKKKTDSIPVVFYKGEIKINKKSIIIFAAEWLEDYHEFHLSYDDEDSLKKIIVWDYKRGNYYLNKKDTKELYFKVAEILTECFDPVTYYQIMPWHHAAGDFVIKKKSDGIDVKLITIRQYTPIIDDKFPDENPDLEITLFFLINLSIRMRLDRIDGIKELCWSDDIAVKSTIDGFLHSLDKKGFLGGFNISYEELFRYYLKKIDLDEIKDKVDIISSTYNSGSPDIELIEENKILHSKIFYDVISNLE